MGKLSTAGVACGMVLAGGLAAVAWSQPAKAPPSWDALTRCAEIGDRDDRVDCYDAAMRAAGYAPRPEVVAESRRRFFGLSVPEVNLRRGKHNDEAKQSRAEAKAERKRQEHEVRQDEDNVTVTLVRVATEGPGTLLMVTDEGQIWEQSAAETITHTPKAGDTMDIHRSKFGGYFCDITSYQSIRCKRLR